MMCVLSDGSCEDISVFIKVYLGCYGTVPKTQPIASILKVPRVNFLLVYGLI